MNRIRQRNIRNDLQEYTLVMMLRSFDTEIVFASELESSTTAYLFHYSNGDAETYVRYTQGLELATFIYKPSVPYYLMSAHKVNTAKGLDGE